MNFDGFTPYPIDRFSSLVQMDDPTNLPLGVSPEARNISFRLTRVRTRDGVQNSYGFILPDGGPVTGLGALKVGGSLGDLQVPIAFSGLGDLYIETPVGSGQCVPITGPLVTLPANASMQVAPAFAKGFLAFGNLKNSLGLPAVYNPKLGKLDPCSMLPVGQGWTADTEYVLGECITPSSPVGGNGRLYQCTQAGVSGAVQPAFTGGSEGPLLAGAGANDGVGATPWTDPGDVTDTDLSSFASVERTTTFSVLTQGLDATGFGFTIPLGAAIKGVVVSCTAYQTIISGGAVQLVGKLLNVSGGSIKTRNAVPNTGDASQLTLGGPNDLWNHPITVADVNDPAFGVAFTVIEGTTAGHSFVFLQNVVITVYYTTPAAIADNTVIWTDVTPTMGSDPAAGNIAFGLRYMVVLFVNRNGYISGMTQASVVSATIGDSVHAIDVTFPTGPENTVARILAFTPAGQLGQLQGTGISSAGPYFWIDPNFPNGIFDLSTVPGGVTVADVVSGVSMNSTLINDNVTTSATLNFTDDYLKATLNDVSSYFRKIKIPGCSDVYYSQVVKRMLYAADNLKSGWYVSLLNDPESVFGDTGLIQVAENNGENRTAVRDYSGVCYVMKEKSGYALVPTADDPSTWDAQPIWTGSGPCGPRAVDVATNFMCYIHRSGVWIFEGGQPYRISKEIPITWSNINWKVQETFWVMIDDETREIRIGVAYGQSSVPNIILKCNYEELPSWSPPSFAPPIHFSPYVGKEIAAGGCYKWSIDDLPANVCIRAERPLLSPGSGLLTIPVPAPGAAVEASAGPSTPSVIAIVNKTVWINPNGGPGQGFPISIPIPAVTAGNSLVLMSGTGNNQALGFIPTLSGAEALTLAQSANNVEMWYLNSALGGETALSLGAAGNAPAWLVLYELTPCTYVKFDLVHQGETAGDDPGPTGLTNSANSAYFCCACAGEFGDIPLASYASVSSPWTADLTHAGIFGLANRGTCLFASLLNATGNNQPIFTMATFPSPSYVYTSAGIVMQGNATPPPPPPPVPTILISGPTATWPSWFDLATTQSQILLGSSNADGAVAAIIPYIFDDNGGGIDSYVETACPVIMDGNGKVVKSLMGPSRLGGVQLNIDGNGQGGVLVLALRGKDPKEGGPPMAGKAKADRGSEIRLKKPWIAGIPYSCGGQMTNERMRLRITNDKQAGTWFDLKWAAIFAQPITTARPK